ncbi:hypothetical protein BpHYR1_023350 [Brachionus plicatilis]|uniref:Uncharacterized protein n=1 Tax=Brachionus plicatilis TaxID=10195 RepID=A0A3M7SJV2_BRAPC|nr:hypothetical protein BpHYR1_023350 [Brachionus plicatilis]
MSAYVKLQIIAYRIPLFSDACFNTMSRIFGSWSNIDLTIPMARHLKHKNIEFQTNKVNVFGLSIFNVFYQKINLIFGLLKENFIPGKKKYPYHFYRTKKKDFQLKCGPLARLVNTLRELVDGAVAKLEPDDECLINALGNM